ncbi:MAG: hypothetical protein ACYTFK_14870 [Planctomycetota bacterium]|jgi:hypothetical protein
MNKPLIRKALERFKDIVDSLECGCDEAYGFRCSLHKDSELAERALKSIEQGHMSDLTDLQNVLTEWYDNQAIDILEFVSHELDNKWEQRVMKYDRSGNAEVDILLSTKEAVMSLLDVINKLDDFLSTPE